MTLTSILLLIGLLCFFLSTFGIPVGKLNLLSLGLFCWLLAEVIGKGIF